MPVRKKIPAPPAERRVEVAVVGGGIAGLTSALKLAQRGYAVTLFEAADVLGGNLSSERINDLDYDVYPHMFADWYANFWTLFETDLGLDRLDHFVEHAGFKLRDKGVADYVELYNATTLKTIWRNLTSGVLPPPDFFLFGFYMLDLASHPFDEMSLLSRLTVNGHLYSRGYTTERVATFSNYILQLIWSIPSDRSSAPSYQDFIKHTLQFPRPTPFAWLLKGSLQERLIAPLAQKLTSLGCELRTGATVTRVELQEGEPVLTLAGGETVRADHLVLAVTAPALAKLVMDGPAGSRIVDQEPQLSQLAQLEGESIPVVNVVFKTKLPDIPAQIVGLTHTDLALSFLDLSQTWTTPPGISDQTVLALACSNAYALPTPVPHERGHFMIQRLHDYLPVFEPGKYWGDEDSDICWEKSRYISNDTHRLYIEEVGNEVATPAPSYDTLPRVFFAGDFCRTDVQMATVESAIQSGIQAAQAIQARSPRGSAIEMVPHEVWSTAAFLAAKLALLPIAYAASAWSAAIDPASKIRESELPADTYSPMTATLVLPGAFALDWWKTAYWLAKAVFYDQPEADSVQLGGKADGEAGEGVGPTDDDVPPESLTALGAQALSTAADFLHAVASRAGAEIPGAGGADAPARFAATAKSVWSRIQSRYEATRAGGPAPRPAPGRYQRRWRVKR